MQSFIITALFLYLASCAKEDNSLGKQLEGSWLVRSYLYNDEELLLPDDVYTIDFSAARGCCHPAQRVRHCPGFSDHGAMGLGIRISACRSINYLNRYIVLYVCAG